VIELSKGFAHGFVVDYKADNYYTPIYDRGIAFKGADLKVGWKASKDRLKFSQKDLNQPKFTESEYFQ